MKVGTWNEDRTLSGTPQQWETWLKNQGKGHLGYIHYSGHSVVLEKETNNSFRYKGREDRGWTNVDLEQLVDFVMKSTRFINEY